MGGLFVMNTQEEIARAFAGLQLRNARLAAHTERRLTMLQLFAASVTPAGAGMSSGTKKSACNAWLGSKRY